MSACIQDAFNLEWKLAAVVRGEARAPLLDSYGPGRLPLARQLIEWTNAQHGARRVNA